MSTMTIIRDSRTIRNKPASQRRNARVALSLLVLIFICTSALAFIFTPSNESPPRPFTVTATVVQPAAGESSADSSTSDVGPESKILSEANLTRAVEIVSPKKKYSSGITGMSLKDLRDKLSVTSEKMAGGQVKTTIIYSGHGSSAQACRLVDALAEEFARQDTDQRRGAARAVHEEAKKAADEANRELVQARDDYEAFVEEHFNSTLSLPSTGPVPKGVQLSPPTPGLHFARPDWAETPESPTLTNPRWTELNNKLARLKNRLAGMLEKMTSAHPDVQNVESEIENLQRQIASLPREVPRPGRDNLSPITPKPPDPTDDLLAPGGEGRLSVEKAKIHRKAPSLTASTSQSQAELNPRLEKDFRQKQKTLESARQKYDLLAGLERSAWQKLGNVQSPEVIPAIGPETAPRSVMDTASELPPRHLLASLIIGLCGTVGIGMFSSGFSSAPTFADVAEVRDTLKVPVVGTMPAADLPGTERPSTKRPSLAVSGLLFLMAAVAMVITSFVIM